MGDSKKFAASIMGLVLVWGGAALLLSPAAVFIKDPASIAGKCAGQIALWLLFASVLLIVVFWEKQSIGSLWLKPFKWQSVAWGGLLVLVYLFLLFPVTEWLRKMFRLTNYAAGMEQVLALPLWFRVVAVLTAGVVEETLFRAYTVTRLAQLSGSLWLAAALSATAFAAIHIPVWGVGPAFAFLLNGAIMTAFFIWKRDLLAMICAHVVIDAWAFIATPHFSEWWK
jgi:uncharacterized protein